MIMLHAFKLLAAPYLSPLLGPSSRNPSYSELMQKKKDKRPPQQKLRPSHDLTSRLNLRKQLANSYQPKSRNVEAAKIVPKRRKDLLEDRFKGGQSEGQCSSFLIHHSLLAFLALIISCLY